MNKTMTESELEIAIRNITIKYIGKKISDEIIFEMENEIYSLIRDHIENDIEYIKENK